MTYINPSELNASSRFERDLRIDLSTGGSKILIYHTHSQETFADSDNDPSTSIVGIGRYLTEILNNKYKIPTMHHEGVYDLINGKLTGARPMNLPNLRWNRSCGKSEYRSGDRSA